MNRVQHEEQEILEVDEEVRADEQRRSDRQHRGDEMVTMCTVTVGRTCGERVDRAALLR